MATKKEMYDMKVEQLSKEFKKFRRKYTMTCNAIRIDEVAQFVIYKQNQKVKS